MLKMHDVMLQRFDEYLTTEEKLWNDTCENHLEYLRTLYAKKTYARKLRERVRAASFFDVYFIFSVLYKNDTNTSMIYVIVIKL